MSHTSCPECGARIAQGADRCDLCGAPLEASEADAAVDFTAGDIPEPVVAAEGTFCNACGAKNPPTANFCSRCGARLRSAPASEVDAAATPEYATDPAAAEAERRGEQSAMTRHVGILVGLSVLVVVALYLITVMSKQQGPGETEAVASAPATAQAASLIDEHEAMPVGEAFRGRVDSLEAVIEDADDADAVQARRELADFLIGIGRIDRAAIEQQRVARITEQAADWKKAGNLLFDWMETSEPAKKTPIALLAIDAYKQLLNLQPDDLDARADLAWAYQYDPQNPMQAIQQTNLVLEEDPDHLSANYNKGVFLMRINRLDQALEQFERVKSIAGSDSPYARQADLWIETIREARAEEEGAS